jgi:hypothetical protein
VESDYVYDTGHVVGEKGILLWAPAGFRPRVLLTSEPAAKDGGTLVVRPGDPPRVLRLFARDVAGASVEKEVVLRGPQPGERGPDTTLAGGRAERDSSRWFELSALPDHYLRVTYRGAPAGSRSVTIGGRRASLRDGEWTAVVALPRGGLYEAFSPWVTGQDANGRPWWRSFRAGLRGMHWQLSDEPEFDWTLDRSARFEPGPVLFHYQPGTGSSVTPYELALRSPVLQLMPVSLPLRKPLRIQLSSSVSAQPRVGLYADDGSGWSWLTATLDSATQRRMGETRHLGRFALFEDTLAPRITLRRPPRRGLAGPYSRWALEARLTEQGSGVDARACRLVVDGRRVPSEWDSEEGVLRWRPRRRPAAGVHRYTLVAIDRAGNQRRAAGRFTLQ